MNENAKNWVWLIVILLIWALGATGTAIYFHNKYVDIQSAVESAGDADFAKLIQQQGDTIISLQNDLTAANGHIRAADERAEHAERLNERAYRIAEQSDAEFIELRNAMASTGGTIQAAIQLQQRIIDTVARIESNNIAIKVELGVRDGAGE